MLQTLARVMYRRRRRVLVGWFLLLFLVVALASGVGGAFRTDFDLPGSESQAAIDLLERSGFGDRGGQQGQVVFTSSRGVDDPAVRAEIEPFLRRVDRTVSRATVVSPYSPEGARQIAEGGRIAYAEVNLADRSEEALQDAGNEIEALAEDVQVPGGRIELGGDMFVAEMEQGTSEAVGLLAAMIILLVAFGSVLAMGLPLLTALFGIGTGAAIVLMARNLLDMPNFTMAAVAMVGIGVGIDYALFIVTRYREGLRAGFEPEHAVVRSIDTAGRAVLFAGTTVMISVLGLLLMRGSSTRGVAIAISVGVLMTMLASVTLLPALLGFVGRNIDKLGLPHRKRRDETPHASVWYRWSRVLQRRPWPAFFAGLAILLVLAAPALSMRLGFADAGNRPTTDTTRQAYDLLSEGFGPGFNGPLLLATETPDGDGDATALEQLSTQLNDTSGVAFATPPQASPDASAAIIQVFPTTAPQDEETADLVTRLRDEVVPGFRAESGLDVKVGGVTAAVDDFAAYTADQLPVFIGAVLLLSFLLLMVVFRSLLVPLKAVVMNLLSIGAAYGVVVAVFQWAWGGSLVGVGKEGPVEAWAPMFLFAIVFGLSMDYEVFLLSRIREEYDRTHDNATAVANGVAVTARVITAAAAIMVCVFGSFVFGPDRALQLFGLGLAVAVLIDATVVRLVLVPATMELLGDRNWWLPRWLDRILPRVQVEASSDLDAELAELSRAETPEPAR
jgi:putative drug exporter of the RND superfamily